MREKQRPIEVFNLSFLDVISCGFGAIILLLVLSLALEPATLQRISSDLSQEVEEVNEERALLVAQSQALQKELTKKRETLGEVRDVLTELFKELDAAQKGDASGQADEQSRIKEDLEVVLQSLTKEMKNLLSQQERKSPKDDAVIGGIPVDSEYIIFVIDTSGSMLSGAWTTVIKKMEEVLSVYPNVKGIQVMNDMGNYMFSEYAGLWIPDTPSRRKEVVRRLRGWQSFSNSSPVEGVTHAVKTYFKKDHRISVYVFGDDFSSGNTNAVLKEVANINKQNASGETLVRIHTFGFPVLFKNKGASQNRTRFAHLMRLLAEQNAGSFVGLTDSM